MLAHIAHKGHNAHAPGQEQGGGIRLHNKAVAQGAPDAHAVPSLELGHAFGALAPHLEEANHMTGRHVANAQRTRPRDVQPEVVGTEHHKLTRLPLRPFRTGEPQGEEAAFMACLAKRHQIQNLKLAGGWLRHASTIGAESGPVNSAQQEADQRRGMRNLKILCPTGPAGRKPGSGSGCARPVRQRCPPGSCPGFRAARPRPLRRSKGRRCSG